LNRTVGWNIIIPVTVTRCYRPLSCSIADWRNKGSKSLLQQNRSFLNSGWWLTQVDLHSGCNMIVVVARCLVLLCFHPSCRCIGGIVSRLSVHLHVCPRMPKWENFPTVFPLTSSYVKWNFFGQSQIRSHMHSIE